MKKFLLIFLFVLGNYYLGTSQQILIDTVKTPKGSIVPYTYIINTVDPVYTSSEIAQFKNDLKTLYYDAELIDLPSPRYNCHGYAWHVSEGGGKVWINTPGHEEYWNSGSYSFCNTNPNQATKIFYYSNDHSAINIDNTWYQSKWRHNYLVKHKWNVLPIDWNVTYNNRYFFKRTDYTVSFNTQGGSATQSQTVQCGKYAFNPTEPTKSGFTFGGWYLTSNCSGSSVNIPNYKITMPNTFYAKWGHTVSFNANGGSPTPPNQYVDSGNFATQPLTPTKSSSVLGGWYDNSNFTGSSVIFTSYPINSNITFYAKWVAPGFDFVIKNNTTHNLSGVFVRLTGIIGAGPSSSYLIASNQFNLLSGNSFNSTGFDLTQPAGTSINSLQLSITATFSLYPSTTININASLDNGGSSGSNSFTANNGQNTFILNLSPSTTISNSSRRILTININ